MRAPKPRQRVRFRYNAVRRSAEGVIYLSPKHRQVRTLATWAEARIIGRDAETLGAIYASEADKEHGNALLHRRYQEALAEAVAGQPEPGPDPGRPLRDVAADFFRQYDRKKAGEAERLIAKDVLPTLGDTPVREIRQREVRALFRKISARAPVAANRTLAYLRRLFNWAIDEEECEVNPCLRIERNRERSRERVLSESEIRTLWRGLETPKISEGSRAALRMILATAQRPGEVRDARAEEIEDGVWSLAADRTKASRGHRVPLNRITLALLTTRPAEGYLFPGRNRSELPQPLSSKALSQALLRNTRDPKLKAKDLPPGDDRIPIQAVTPHDLRRTAASHMAALGVSRETLARVLNHADPSVTAIYDRYGYEKEIGRALATWGEKLERILAKGRPTVTKPSRARAK